MTYVISMQDQAGALERLLNLCRRKGYAIRTLQSGPDGPGLRTVALELEADAPPASRVLVNIARLHDVVSVEQTDAATHALAAQSTLPQRATRAA